MPSPQSDDQPVRFGILATGRIAASFATDLHEVPGADLVAVGSRSEEGAARFAEKHAGPGCRAHGSYDALLADPDVDVVYVASPHALHLEHARGALEAGKHVLCEKPLTINHREATELVATARRTDRFLMEAMWTACHPVVRAVVAGLRDGRFGTPRQLHADLGGVFAPAVDDRLADPALGAGALLDIGIYPLTLADLLLGPAVQVAATADLAPSGIDLDVAMATRHEGGALGALTASMTSHSPRSAVLATDTGPAHAAGAGPPPRPRRLAPCRRAAGADRGGRAAAGHRPRQRGGRGGALRAGRAAREPAGAARAVAAADGADGRRTPPGRRGLPHRRASDGPPPG